MTGKWENAIAEVLNHTTEDSDEELFTLILAADTAYTIRCLRRDLRMEVLNFSKIVDLDPTDVSVSMPKPHSWELFSQCFYDGRAIDKFIDRYSTLVEKRSDVGLFHCIWME